MAYFSDVLKDMNLKLSHNMDTGLKIVSNFHSDTFISSEVIACIFCEDGFWPSLHTFLRITHEPLKILKI